MPSLSVVETVDQPDSLLLIAERDLPQWLSTQSAALQDWLPRSGFKPDVGRSLVLPGDSHPRTVLVGTGKGAPDGNTLLWLAAGLSDRLPAGDYALAAEFGDAVAVLGPVATAVAERFADFVTVGPNRLGIRRDGVPLARIMASAFDGYLDAGGRFSRAS